MITLGDDPPPLSWTLPQLRPPLPREFMQHFTHDRRGYFRSCGKLGAGPAAVPRSSPSRSVISLLRCQNRSVAAVIPSSNAELAFYQRLFHPRTTNSRFTSGYSILGRHTRALVRPQRFRAGRTRVLRARRRARKGCLLCLPKPKSTPRAHSEFPALEPAQAPIAPGTNCAPCR